MKKFTILFALIFILGAAYNGEAQTRQADSLALVGFYNRMNGVNWSNSWNLSQSMGSWQGVTVVGGRVTKLELYGQNLSNSLPANLNLTALEMLYLNSCQLRGAIPEFTNLPNLKKIVLSSNSFTGTLPSFTNQAKLTGIFMYNCQLTGAIPNLNHLDSLEYLDLRNNQFSGTIPAFNLPKLIQLKLMDNQLSGTIPTLTLPSLSNLVLDDNQFSGNFPSLAAMDSLEQISLGNNQFTGELPSLAHLDKLYYFYAEGNQFSDIAPNFVTQGQQIRMFLSNNHFTFEDLLPSYPVLIAATPTYEYDYHSQDSVGSSQNIAVPVGSDYTIDLGIDSSLSGNVYQWYKDGVFLTTITGNNQYTITNFQAANTGVYTVSITNNTLTKPNNTDRNLTLYSRTITLNIASSTSIIDQSSLVLSPNPVNDWLHIRTQNISGDYTVQLINLQGQILEQIQGQNTNDLVLPMADKAAGLYLVQVIQNDKIWQQKVIKE